MFVRTLRPVSRRLAVVSRVPRAAGVARSRPFFSARCFATSSPSASSSSVSFSSSPSSPSFPSQLTRSKSTYTTDGKQRVTIAYGDGIGPEIMTATLRVLEKAGAQLDFETIKIGESVYANGISSGIEPSGWQSLDRTRCFLKAPITTPLGGGVKSLNVTVRKTLGLYSNVRPVFSYHPFVHSLHPNIDMIVVRENEEDLYAGIEHRHTSEVVQCIKLVTIPGSLKICRYAFDLARSQNRRKVTCITKNNIMKLTDGVFYKAFQDVARHYPEIEAEHKIVDIATAQVATKPHLFDVIVTLNLYGDIISDVAADVAGSVGLAGSANIGDHHAMFEAVHGSAPDIAGKNIANPAGLINGAIMMLAHLGQREPARAIKNALLVTLEEGIHTADIYRDVATGSGGFTHSKVKAGTKEFADAIISNLGRKPTALRASQRRKQSWPQQPSKPAFVVPEVPVERVPVKSLVGVDIFVDWDQHRRNPDVLAGELLKACHGDFKLQMISNRGVKVWPNGHPDTYKVNHWRCRFMFNDEPPAAGSSAASDQEDEGGEADSSHKVRAIPALMSRLVAGDIDVIKTENLYLFDGQPGFSMGQGQ